MNNDNLKQVLAVIALVLLFAAWIAFEQWNREPDRVITAPAVEVHSTPKIYEPEVPNTVKHPSPSVPCKDCGVQFTVNGKIVDYWEYWGE